MFFSLGSSVLQWPEYRLWAQNYALAPKAVSSNSVRGSASTPMNVLPMICDLKGHACHH